MSNVGLPLSSVSSKGEERGHYLFVVAGSLLLVVHQYIGDKSPDKYADMNYGTYFFALQPMRMKPAQSAEQHAMVYDCNCKI